LIAPLNAGFFAAGLADLQGFLNIDEISDDFKPSAIIFLAPPFRHTHFEGKQIVVHNRLEEFMKYILIIFIQVQVLKREFMECCLILEKKKGWVTAHASTVKVITPYDNEIVIMHEGASGGGKSEMIEDIHKEMDGRVLLEKYNYRRKKLSCNLNETCELLPVTDDMALCHPNMQNESKKLVVKMQNLHGF
jgi:hypothetical protein